MRSIGLDQWTEHPNSGAAAVLARLGLVEDPDFAGDYIIRMTTRPDLLMELDPASDTVVGTTAPGTQVKLALRNRETILAY